MMCKILLMAALVTGLLVLSDATLRSKFIYKKDMIDKEIVVGMGQTYKSPLINITTTDGVIKGFNDMEIVTDWIEISEDDEPAISANMALPQLKITLKNVNVSYSGSSKLSPLALVFSKLSLNATLTATRTAEAECKIKSFTILADLELDLDNHETSYLTEILRDHSTVKAEFLGNVSYNLESILAFLVPMVLQNKIECMAPLNVLCDKFNEAQF